MTVEAQARIQTGNRATPLALRLALDCGLFSIPLQRLHHLCGFAALAGVPEDYFLGWLAFRGGPVPVFDLNRVVCDRATPERFGSRILIVPAGASGLVGLLAGGVTDTLPANAQEAEPLDLDSYLPMLCTMIPPAIPPAPANL
jgi:chemotaxis signal transduction protein